MKDYVNEFKELIEKIEADETRIIEIVMKGRMLYWQQNDSSFCNVKEIIIEKRKQLLSELQTIISENTFIDPQHPFDLINYSMLTK